jgi:hypothetical protein
MIIDPDDDEITYILEIKDKQLPSWIQFDAKSLVLRSSPKKEDITFEKDNNRYFQSFNLTIIGKDPSDAFESFTFNFTVLNEPPKL